MKYENDDMNALERLHSDFCSQMWEQIVEKHNQGYRGWDIPDFITDEDLENKIQEKFEQMDWLALANYSMLLWNRYEKTPV